MKYLILFTDEIDQMIAHELAQELSRFDVRCELLLNDLTSITEGNIDAWISIGEEKNRSKLAKTSTHQFSIPLTFKGSKSKFSKGVKRFDTFPKADADYQGFVFFDLLKRMDKRAGEDQESEVLSIVSGYEKPSHLKEMEKLKAKLQPCVKNLEIQLVNLDDAFDPGIQAIAQSKVVLSTSPVGAFASVFYNVPYIRLYQKGWWRSFRGSELNALLGNTDLPEISISKTEQIAQEVNRIESDYEHLASIMESYQQLKSLLSLQPALRNIARSIVDALDN